MQGRRQNWMANATVRLICFLNHFCKRNICESIKHESAIAIIYREKMNRATSEVPYAFGMRGMQICSAINRIVGI